MLSQGATQKHQWFASAPALRYRPAKNIALCQLQLPRRRTNRGLMTTFETNVSNKAHSAVLRCTRSGCALSQRAKSTTRAVDIITWTRTSGSPRERYYDRQLTHHAARPLQATALQPECSQKAAPLLQTAWICAAHSRQASLPVDEPTSLVQHSMWFASNTIGSTPATRNSAAIIQKSGPTMRDASPAASLCSSAGMPR